MEPLRRSPYAHVVATDKGYAFFNKAEVQPELPQYGSEEIVVRPLVIAVCGSDAHAHAQDEGTHPLAKGGGFIPFHEGVAEIMAVGSEAKGLKSGDRVAVESTIFSECPPGRWSLTPDTKMKIVGLGTDGLGAEMAVLPGKVAIPISPDVPDEIGAQFEPLGVSVHAWMRAINVYEALTGKKAKDAWYLINGGTGSVGGLALASLIAEGVPEEHIIATGTTQGKLDRLKENYPRIIVLNLGDADKIQQVLKQIAGELEQFGGAVPIVIEATGHDPKPILPFVGKDTVFTAVGLSGNLGEGEVDTNNVLVRRQRIILTAGETDEAQLKQVLEKIYHRTVQDQKPATLIVDSAEVLTKPTTAGKKFDIIVDKIGVPAQTIDTLLNKGGIWVAARPVEGNSPLPTGVLLEKGAVLVGSWGRDEEDWRVMSAQVAEQRLDPAKLPIRLFEFNPEGLADAFENSRAGKVGFDLR